MGIDAVITQYSDQAAFLWLVRDRAVCAPHYRLHDLAKLDERLEAHLDALRIAEAGGWEVCKEALTAGDSGNVFAAALLALDGSDPTRLQAVLEAAEQDPELCRGLVSALGWLPLQLAQECIGAMMAEKSGLRHYVGLAGAAAQRLDLGPPLLHGVWHAHAAVRARALQAFGELGKLDLLPVLRQHAADDDALCRYSAAWSAALLGDADAVQVLRCFAGPDCRWGEEALRVALRQMPLSSAMHWQKELWERPELSRLAVIGPGIMGDPALAEWLIDQMRVPSLARLAGESFSMITGVDIAYEDLDGEWPEGFEAGPTENPEDEDVEMEPDEDLPWPNPELMGAWWDKNKGRFKKGTRYLCGEPITESQLQHVLRYGYQRQRYAAALELATMHPGQPLFNVCAPGFRQKKLLGL